MVHCIKITSLVLPRIFLVLSVYLNNYRLCDADGSDGYNLDDVTIERQLVVR